MYVNYPKNLQLINYRVKTLQIEYLFQFFTGSNIMKQFSPTFAEIS